MREPIHEGLRGSSAVSLRPFSPRAHFSLTLSPRSKDSQSSTERALRAARAAAAGDLRSATPAAFMLALGPKRPPVPPPPHAMGASPRGLVRANRKLTLSSESDYMAIWREHLSLFANKGVSPGVSPRLQPLASLDRFAPPPPPSRSSSSRDGYLIERLQLEHGLRDEQIVGQLRKVEWFASLPYSELLTLVARGAHKFCPRYSTLFREDNEGSSFFILLQGKMRCTSTHGLNVLHSPGASFGERALITSRVVRDTTAVAEADSYLLSFTASDVRGLAVELDAVRAEVVDELMQRLSVFEALSKAQRVAVATIMDVEEFASGATVYAEGDKPNAVYFLLEGRVGLHKRAAASGLEEIVWCAAGSERPWCGEAALSSVRPRAQTAVCHEPTKALVVRTPKLAEFVEQIGPSTFLRVGAA